MLLPRKASPAGRTPRCRVGNFSEKVSFIWSVADLLRGPYKPHQYGRVILPLTVLRRLDCVLEPTKAKVLEKHAALKDSKIKDPEPILNKVAGHSFHNTSKLNFQKLKGEPDKAAQNLSHYIKSFSSRARQIFDRQARRVRPALPGDQEVRRD
jgi:type I restriction enzyme M protein